MRGVVERKQLHSTLWVSGNGLRRALPHTCRTVQAGQSPACVPPTPAALSPALRVRLKAFCHYQRLLTRWALHTGQEPPVQN